MEVKEINWKNWCSIILCVDLFRIESFKLVFIRISLRFKNLIMMFGKNNKLIKFVGTTWSCYSKGKRGVSGKNLLPSYDTKILDCYKNNIFAGGSLTAFESFRWPDIDRDIQYIAYDKKELIEFYLKKESFVFAEGDFRLLNIVPEVAIAEMKRTAKFLNFAPDVISEHNFNRYYKLVRRSDSLIFEPRVDCIFDEVYNEVFHPEYAEWAAANLLEELYSVGILNKKEHDAIKYLDVFNPLYSDNQKLYCAEELGVTDDLLFRVTPYLDRKNISGEELIIHKLAFKFSSEFESMNNAFKSIDRFTHFRPEEHPCLGNNVLNEISGSQQNLIKNSVYWKKRMGSALSGTDIDLFNTQTGANFSDYLYFFMEVSLGLAFLFGLGFYVYKNRVTHLFFNNINVTAFVLSLFAILIGLWLQFGTGTLISVFPGSSFIERLHLVPVYGHGKIIFDKNFIVDNYGYFFKILSLISATGVLLLSFSYITYEKFKEWEYSLLILFAIFSIFCLISAYSFLSLYVTIEGVAITSYILTAIRKNKAIAAEGALKYLIMGSIASGFLLFGIYYVYHSNYGHDYVSLSNFLYNNMQFVDGIRTDELENVNRGFIFGFLCIVVSFLFKLSAAPFHMWTPDVYEAAPLPVTLFFSVTVKAAIFAAFIRLLLTVFFPLIGYWQPILLWSAALSMIIGAIGGLQQMKIKRMLAYSSIGHVGYILMALATGTAEGVASSLFYLVVYTITTLGLFAYILAARNNVDSDKIIYITELSRLSTHKKNIVYSLCFFMLVLSLAGIPPLGGFFAKYMVFKAAINGEFYIVAFIGILTSLISCFYYLRVLKLTFFDKAKFVVEFSEEFLTINFVLFFTTFLLTGFIFFVDHLMFYCEEAAKSLFNSTPGDFEEYWYRFLMTPENYDSNHNFLMNKIAEGDFVAEAFYKDSFRQTCVGYNCLGCCVNNEIGAEITRLVLKFEQEHIKVGEK